MSQTSSLNQNYKTLKMLLSNHLMFNGNKRTTEKILLKSFKLTQKLVFKDHKQLFKTAMTNNAPIFSIKQIKRKRKKKKEFPFILKKSSRISFALKFILRKTHNNSNTLPFSHLFGNEMVNASKKHGDSVKYKNLLHEQSFLTKKYAHYRWF